MKTTIEIESYEGNNLNATNGKMYFITPGEIASVMKDYPPGTVVTIDSNRGSVTEIRLPTPAELKSFNEDQKAGKAMAATSPTGKEILQQNLNETGKKPEVEIPPLVSKEASPAAPSKEDLWSKECTEFKALLTSTKRKGIDDLLKYLEESTDFYIAPSSTRYHDANAGGLLHHSLTVYHNLITLSKTFSEDYPEESLIIISLLHDICKTNFYKTSTRNVKTKDKSGFTVWIEEPYIDIEDQFPLGHGEKSVIIIQRYIPLTDNEIMGIRWHMMAYDDVKNSYAGNLAITNASDKFRIIPLMHIADLAASFLVLREGEKS